MRNYHEVNRKQFHWKWITYIGNETNYHRDRETTDLGCGVDGRSMLQEETDHIDLAKVTGSVQWSVTSL